MQTNTQAEVETKTVENGATGVSTPPPDDPKEETTPKGATGVPLRPTSQPTSPVASPDESSKPKDIPVDENGVPMRLPTLLGTPVDDERTAKRIEELQVTMDKKGKVRSARFVFVKRPEETSALESDDIINKCNWRNNNEAARGLLQIAMQIQEIESKTGGKQKVTKIRLNKKLVSPLDLATSLTAKKKKK